MVARHNKCQGCADDFVPEMVSNNLHDDRYCLVCNTNGVARGIERGEAR